MIATENHVLSDFRELWASSKAFRVQALLALTLAVFAGVIGHYAFDRGRPYIFHEEGSFIEPPSGHGGDQITVNWRVTHNRTCGGAIERHLIDPRTGVILAIYDTSPAAENSVPIGSGFLRKTFMIPRSIPKGRIGYKAKLVYQCNWLQVLVPAFAVRYETPVLFFEVE